MTICLIEGGEFIIIDTDTPVGCEVFKALDGDGLDQFRVRHMNPRLAHIVSAPDAAVFSEVFSVVLQEVHLMLHKWFAPEEERWLDDGNSNLFQRPICSSHKENSKQDENCN